MKYSKKTITWIVMIALFFIVGIPIIINESYKLNRGYITVWDGSDVLGYYGTILGSVIAVVSIIVTIVFTKKQIRRDTFLKIETEKWERIREVFLKILNDLNPMSRIKDVMGNGISDPTKAIIVLQLYQMDCKMANDMLMAHLNMNDFQKFKGLINSIASIAEECFSISQRFIGQYTELRYLQSQDIFSQYQKLKKEFPDYFTEKNNTFSDKTVERVKSIKQEDIEQRLLELNVELVRLYEDKYRPLLQLFGETFEIISMETLNQADKIIKL